MSGFLGGVTALTLSSEQVQRVESWLAGSLGWTSPSSASWSDSRDAQSDEVALLPGHRLVRDSELGDASPVLAVSPTEWSAFTAVVKAGHRNG
ncbi:MAG: DUF397 domain-containing protein [Pseudonocardiaceae bacterium]